MKVLLLKDVKGKGKAGDVLNVSDSYGRNVIIAKKLGVEATAANLNDYKLHSKNVEKTKAENLAAAKELAAKIADNELVIPIKVGDGGRAFGSITGKEIAEEMKARCGIDIDRKKVVLASPIKELGEYDVPYKAHQDVEAVIKLKVVSKE